MHELGMVQSMIDVALDYADKNQARKITAFNIEISQTADESEESLLFYFELLSRGTLAEGAHVDLSRVPAQARCADCGNEFALDISAPACPRCAGTNVKPIGDDVRLVSIDVQPREEQAG